VQPKAECRARSHPFRSSATTGIGVGAAVVEYNLLNHPQFSNPGSLNYNNSSNFSSITSVRNATRIMQLALKLYY